MKRVVLIVMLMCVSFTLAAQDDYKNSVSIGLGSVIGTDVGFSPAVDLRYRKELTDNIGLNVGYSFRYCNRYHNYKYIYGGDYTSPYYDKAIFLSNSIFVGLSYNLKLYKDLYMVPMFSVGAGFASCEEIYSKNGEITHRFIGSGPTLSIIPAINLEYNFDRIKLFCSYNYDILFEFWQITKWIDPYNYFLGDFKLGVAFKF